MPSLPAQTVPGFEVQAHADARVLLAAGAPGVVQALYTRASDGATASPVNVIVSPQPPAEPSASVGRAASGGPQSRVRVHWVMACACGPDETIASPGLVGSLGGLVRMNRGDTLLVPGRAVGRAETESLLVTVREDPKKDGGAWTAEVTL